ncbi:MAG: phosphoribosylamine--glycine ligase [Chloroflexota bacterium]
MRVLVVGSGAREHALCWRLVSEGAHVIAAPGNPLMRDVAEVRAEVALGDLAAIVALALAERVDLVVVGPEAPLVAGLVDRLSAAGIPSFGPTAAAARIEASKSYAREICGAAGVPMAQGSAFESVAPAVDYAERLGAPVMVKADGLAAGKGVVICANIREAELTIRDQIEGGRFGAGGRRVVVEQWLAGVEASVIAICDGRDAVILPAARDHKRLGDGDSGPNTGGMGAYSPIPELDDAAMLRLREEIFLPVLREMERSGTPFRGALFAGLMLTAYGPRVLEFNARLGDPETQAILPRLAEPLTPLLVASAAASLAEHAAEGPILATTSDAAVALTLAAAGYPDDPRPNDPIKGIDEARAQEALVFGAGVRMNEDGVPVTAGGRVLTIVGRGSDLASAADVAYEAADRIGFRGKQTRRDIGRALVGATA